MTLSKSSPHLPSHLYSNTPQSPQRTASSDILSLRGISSNTMQQAIPYRSWRSLHTPTPTAHFNPQSFITQTIGNSSSAASKGPAEGATGQMVLNMVSENAVIVFARHGCCMTHVVKRLLLDLGVNPAVYEVDEKDEVGVVRVLEAIGANDEEQGKVQFPAVFIGGRLFGGLDRLMATHISGELIPILKQARALWL